MRVCPSWRSWGAVRGSRICRDGPTITVKRWLRGWAWGLLPVPPKKAAPGSPGRHGASPQGRPAGRANPGGPVPVVVTKGSAQERRMGRSSSKAVGTVQAIASIQIKARHGQPDHEGRCRGGARWSRKGDLLFRNSMGRHAQRRSFAMIEAQIPQGSGADRAGQARTTSRARRTPCSPEAPARLSARDTTFHHVG